MTNLTAFQEQQLEKYARAVEQRAMYTFRYMFDTGEVLNAARAMFPSNQEFGQWREKRLPWLDARIAMHWMNVNKKFRYLSQRNDYYCVALSKLSPSVVYQLAAPSTTEEVIDKVIEEVRKGKTVSEPRVKQMKKKVVRQESSLTDPTVSVENSDSPLLKGNIDDGNLEREVTRLTKKITNMVNENNKQHIIETLERLLVILRK